MRDWAEMARYREANGTVPAAARGEARVVFMGDSITDGWQQPRYGGFFPGKPYVDRGISGQTTPQMLVRFRRDVIDLQPKAVVILAGTNDIAGNTGPMTNEEIQGNLASMSDLAHTHSIKVVFSSITPVSEYHVRGDAADDHSSDGAHQGDERMDQVVRRVAPRLLPGLLLGDGRRQGTDACRAHGGRPASECEGIRDHGAACAGCNRPGAQIGSVIREA